MQRALCARRLARYAGSVCVDGLPVEELGEWYRRNCGFVHQVRVLCVRDCAVSRVEENERNARAV